MTSSGTGDPFAIVANNSSKLFLDGTVIAFHQLTLAVRHQEILCIVARALRQDDAAALHCGPDRYQRRRTSGRRQASDQPAGSVAMVFQHFGLLPWKTVYDNALSAWRCRQAVGVYQRACRPLSRPGRPQWFREALSLQLSAACSSASASCVHCDQPVDPFDGRAIRCARRADP